MLPVAEAMGAIPVAVGDMLDIAMLWELIAMFEWSIENEGVTDSDLGLRLRADEKR
jgi:hypothetical protein